jgi:hypothetical protein
LVVPVLVELPPVDHCHVTDLASATAAEGVVNVRVLPLADSIAGPRSTPSATSSGTEFRTGRAESRLSETVYPPATWVTVQSDPEATTDDPEVSAADAIGASAVMDAPTNAPASRQLARARRSALGRDECGMYSSIVK